jgi:ABC-type glycerol-3-phosphate transport system permease component
MTALETGNNKEEKSGPNGLRAIAGKLLTGFLLVSIFATPYIWMIGSTFKPREELFRYIYPVSWRTFVPLNPTFENLRTLFVEIEFARPLINTAGIAITAVFLSILICSMIGFVLAWIEFPGRELLFFAILATMLIVFEAKLVPLFLIMQQLNLNNTYISIILPWIADAFFIFLFRQHFKSIPKELMEAAIIDGCSYFRVYWNIMLPNIVPALISAAFIKFIFTWDSYIWPLITITDESKQVVSVAIAKLFADEEVLWELVFAGSFVATIPIILLFFFLQRYYIEGVASTGLKG